MAEKKTMQTAVTHLFSGLKQTFHERFVCHWNCPIETWAGWRWPDSKIINSRFIVGHRGSGEQRVAQRAAPRDCCLWRWTSTSAITNSRFILGHRGSGEQRVAQRAAPRDRCLWRWMSTSAIINSRFILGHRGSGEQRVAQRAAPRDRCLWRWTLTSADPVGCYLCRNIDSQQSKSNVLWNKYGRLLKQGVGL